MCCIAGRREELPSGLMNDLGRYRRKVFVGLLGWPLCSSGDVELDEFDGPDAVCVSTQDQDGLVNGVARLLPTTAPYLLEKVFSELWLGSELPHSAQVWELSRFAAVNFTSAASYTQQPLESHSARLFRHVLRIAKELGAHTLVTVSSIGMERLLRVNGFHSMRAGPPVKLGQECLVGLVISLDDMECVR